MSLRRFYGLLCDIDFPSLVHPSLLLAMSTLAFLFFPSRGYKPPPILRSHFNPSSCHQHRRFPVLFRYIKRPDVTLYAIDPPFLLLTRSSPHCTLRVSEHDSLWQPPAAHSGERHRRQVYFCAEGCLIALTSIYLEGMVVELHPVVWQFVLCPDDAKKDPVVCGA